MWVESLAQELCGAWERRTASHSARSSKPIEIEVEETDEVVTKRDEEHYDAVAYSVGRAPLHLKNVSLETLHEHAEVIRLVQSIPPLRNFDLNDAEYDGPIHLFVCTHAARDCRCGETGAAFADKLLDEVSSDRCSSKH